VLNLIVNACDSMNGISKANRRLIMQLKQTSQHRLELLVTDCGIGLPIDNRERVFEPFFTTKEKGLGLGLAISRSIATTHGGRLWGENNPKGGATFHLELPAAMTIGSTGPTDAEQSNIAKPKSRETRPAQRQPQYTS
jgi:C4-dicarboxylate-specific signal transduction histidine kinase